MLGIMQGRLSPPLTEKIQEFPATTWKNEFSKASSIGIQAIEWTVDLEDFKLNPLFNLSNKQELAELQEEFSISIPSVTLDCFVEAPLHKANALTGLKSDISDLVWIAERIHDTDVEILVLPIVAEGADFNYPALESLISTLNGSLGIFRDLGKKIAIECEFDLTSMEVMLNSLDSDIFGVNFDMGNSAAIGHKPIDELEICKGRIFNVHIKDRILGGHTVPLGKGSVNFIKVAQILKEHEYSGNLILQAARNNNCDEVEQIVTYLDFCRNLGW